MFLSAIQLSRREFPLLTSLVGVNLRLINFLIGKMPDDPHIVENILNHFHKLQATEKYYHLHKKLNSNSSVSLRKGAVNRIKMDLKKQ
jgi:hypothetical protein